MKSLKGVGSEAGYCSFRWKVQKCPASVIERDGYHLSVEHNHPGEVGLTISAMLTTAVKRKAEGNILTSVDAIVDEVLMDEIEEVSAPFRYESTKTAYESVGVRNSWTDTLRYFLPNIIAHVYK